MRICAIVLLFVPCLSGCLIMGGGNRIVYDEEIRYAVYFETPKAAHEFYEALDASDTGKFTRGGGVVIPFVFATGGATYYETQHFNDMVRRVDADRDDRITEEECAAYRGM